MSDHCVSGPGGSEPPIELLGDVAPDEPVERTRNWWPLCFGGLVG